MRSTQQEGLDKGIEEYEDQGQRGKVTKAGAKQQDKSQSKPKRVWERLLEAGAPQHLLTMRRLFPTQCL